MVPISRFLMNLLVELDSMTNEKIRANQQAILSAEADAYMRFTELDLKGDVEFLNEIGYELMKIINCGTSHTLEEVQARVSKCIRNV